MSESIEKRVARGAAWMDEVAPGWERQVDVGILDIASCEVCILGQVEVAAARACPGELWDHGLNTEASHSSPEGKREGREIADAWIALLKERFDSGALSDVP